MRIVIEIPGDDETSGGIARMIRLAFELPHFTPVAGGIKDSIILAEKISPNVHIRFQKRTIYAPLTNNSWSIGLPNASFPAADIVITYSDTPYLKELIALPQVSKVMIYMLSYGMCYEREMPNVLNPNIMVICSTKKIEDAIIKDGGKVTRVGFGLDMKEFKFINHEPRKNYLALMYNNMKSKRYEIGVEVADILFDEGIIEGVLTFGRKEEYFNYKHPKGLIRHTENASKKQVAEIFNQCKCYLMPSISEGLNLTPMESNLCGCPSIFVDGAFGEIYEDKENCFCAEPGNILQMCFFIKEIINNFDEYSEKFEKKSRELILPYTWDKVINNIINLL